MKAVSLLQPFGTLILQGRKTLESRTWPIKASGDLLICASLGVHKGSCLLQGTDIDCQGLVRDLKHEFPRGVALCVVELVDCRPMKRWDEEKACCRLYDRAYVWELQNIRPVRQVPIKGSLGIFTVDDSLIEYL